jgi:hypothetical protein
MRPIALDIRAALNSMMNDGSLLIRISGVPENAALSAGIKGVNGVWILSPDDLAGLTLSPAAGSELEFELRIRAITIEGEAGDRARVMQKLKLTVKPGVAGEPCFSWRAGALATAPTVQ